MVTRNALVHDVSDWLTEDITDRTTATPGVAATTMIAQLVKCSCCYYSNSCNSRISRVVVVVVVVVLVDIAVVVLAELVDKYLLL